MLHIVPRSFGECVVFVCLFLLVGAVTFVFCYLLAVLVEYLFKPGVFASVVLFVALVYSIVTLRRRWAS